MAISGDFSLDVGVNLGGGGKSAPTAAFDFVVNPFSRDHFMVHSFRGREELSGLYTFDVTVTGAEATDGIVEERALGQRAVLTMRGGKVSRSFHGIISEVRLVGRHSSHEVSRYRMRLVPRMWLLRRRKRSRIFQDMTVEQVVTAVLTEARIEFSWRLRRSYPTREYCTQYEETDYQFVTRLLAEAGIFFFFTQPPSLLDDAIGAAEGALGALGALGAAAGAGARAVAGDMLPEETVVFSDDASFYPPIDDGSGAGDVLEAIGVPTAISASVAGISVSASISPALYYLALEGTTTPAWDKVSRFIPARSVRSNTAAYREFDPDRPQVVLAAAASAAEAAASGVAGSIAGAAAASLGAQASFSMEGGLQAGASLDLSAIAGAAVAASVRETHELEVYEHHGNFLFPKWTAASEEPELILRQKRRRAEIAEGESTCLSVAAGQRFTLEEHPSEHVNRPYAVVSVRHEGRATSRGSTEGWDVYRNRFTCVPERVSYCPPRPKRRNVLVALTATVVGPLGEEIYVDALGQVKAQFHWDREGARDDRSSCWLRTMQAWGGAGWGTHFIPRVGMEVVVTFEGGDPDKPMILGCVYNGTHPPPFLLPAEKTRSGVRTQSTPGAMGNNELSFEDAAGREQIYVHAQRDLDEVVERNHTARVKGDEATRIEGSRREDVAGNTSESVGGRAERRIASDETTQVDGNRIDVVTGNADYRVSGMVTKRIEGRELRDVQESADLRYADDLTTRVRGCHTTLVGRADAKRSYLVHVEGVSTLSSIERMEISSEEELVLRVGKSAIRITSDRIELCSPQIGAKGDGGGLSIADDGLSVRSKGEAQFLADKMLFKTEAASIAMGKEMKVDAEKVLLNSPEQATDAPPKEPSKTTTIELVDTDGNPLAYQRYLLVLDDGSEQSGVLDKDGRAEVDVEASGTILFPDLSEVEPG